MRFKLGRKLAALISAVCAGMLALSVPAGAASAKNNQTTPIVAKYSVKHVKIPSAHGKISANLVTSLTLFVPKGETPPAVPDSLCCDGGAPPPGCTNVTAQSQVIMVDPTGWPTYARRSASVDGWCWDSLDHVISHGPVHLEDWALPTYCWESVDQGSDYSADQTSFVAWNHALLGWGVWISCGMTGTQPMSPYIYVFPGGAYVPLPGPA
jgi:hypothetical protein